MKNFVISEQNLAILKQIFLDAIHPKMTAEAILNLHKGLDALPEVKLNDPVKTPATEETISNPEIKTEEPTE